MLHESVYALFELMLYAEVNGEGHVGSGRCPHFMGLLPKMTIS